MFLQGVNNEKSGNSLLLALTGSNTGFGSENFKVDRNIILVKKNKTEKLNLTAYWYPGGNVKMTYSPAGIANITFDNNNWSNSTTISVKGLKEGISKVTFENDQDKSKFNILVIVN